MVGQVGRRAFWHIKCTLKICDCVGRLVWQTAVLLMHRAGHGGALLALWGGGGAVAQGGVFWCVILHRAKARRTLTRLPYLVQLSDNKHIRKKLFPVDS